MIIFDSVKDLITALTDAATAHHKWEQESYLSQSGQKDEHWQKWYAEWIARTHKASVIDKPIHTPIGTVTPLMSILENQKQSNNSWGYGTDDGSQV